MQRSLALALIAGLLGFCIWVGVRVTQQGREARRGFARLSGQRLPLVVVEIERRNLVPPRRRVGLPVRRRRHAAARLHRARAKETPLFVSADEKLALALRGEAGGMPLLLDARLDMLDLTETERDAFHAACRAAFAGRRMRHDGQITPWAASPVALWA